MATLFIADLHLTAERPAGLRLFRRFLSERAWQAETLYILGDLFEAWLGDDLLLPGYDGLLSDLRDLTESGVPVYAMHGNRDFLLGPRFEQTTGVQLLPEPTRCELYGRPTLLLHGDLLCTDDTAYQALRRTLRDPAWIAKFLAKPPEERIALARELREKSSEEIGSKEAAIMDVNPSAVAAAAHEHEVECIIHGHTHRPAHHRHQVEGREVERYVVGDWGDHAMLLACDPEGCRLERFE